MKHRTFVFLAVPAKELFSHTGQVPLLHGESQEHVRSLSVVSEAPMVVVLFPGLHMVKVLYRNGLSVVYTCLMSSRQPTVNEVTTFAELEPSETSNMRYI